MNFNEKQRFSIRKLSVGVCSVLIVTTLVCGSTAQASNKLEDDIANQSLIDIDNQDLIELKNKLTQDIVNLEIITDDEKNQIINSINQSNSTEEILKISKELEDMISNNELNSDMTNHINTEETKVNNNEVEKNVTEIGDIYEAKNLENLENEHENISQEEINKFEKNTKN